MTGCRQHHLAQVVGADLVPEAPRAAVNADDDAAGFEAEGLGDFRRENAIDALQLQIMVARTQRAHLVALTFLGVPGNGAGIRTGHAAPFLDAIEVRHVAVALLDGPARAAAQHVRHPAVVEPNAAGAADAGRNSREQFVGECRPQPFQVSGTQIGHQRPDPAGDVEADTARRDNAARVRVERGDAADRKAITPVGVGHRICGADDARECRDVAELFVDLVVEILHQRAVSEQDAGHAHAAPRLDSPLVVVDAVQLLQVHLYVNHALRAPAASVEPAHLERGVRRALDLHRRFVSVAIHRFTARTPAEPVIVQRHVEFAEQHSPRRHLIDQRVQPVDQQQLVVRRLALHVDLLDRIDRIEVSDRRCHRPGDRDEQSGPIVRGGAQPDVGAVRKVFPSRFHPVDIVLS